MTQTNSYIHSKTDLFNNRFKNHTNAYTILDMGAAAQHQSWLDGGNTPAYHNAAEYNLDGFDWAEAAAKIASGEMTASQVVADFTPLSITNIQYAIDKLTYEKGHLVNSNLNKRLKVKTVIDALNALKKQKQNYTIDVNTGSATPPVGTMPSFGSAPTWGGIAELFNPTVNNGNTVVTDGNSPPQKNNTSKYLLYGGIGVGVVVLGVVLYAVLKPKK